MADCDARPARRHRHTHRPPAVVNRLILEVLRSRRLHGLLDGQLCEVRYRAADGRPVSLPVRYAVAGERYVVLVGDASMSRSVNTCRRHLSDQWFDEWRDFPPINSMRACCPPTGGCGGPR